VPVSPAPSDALIVFAKAPVPGGVKTRLTGLLTDAEAARLYEAFLRDGLEAYRRLAADVRLYLAPAPGDHGSSPGQALAEGLAPEGVTVHAQRGGDLGERMLNGFVETFLAGYGRAVVLGTDHPTLPLAFVERAFAELAAPFSTVLGPSEDGGYYLLGMNELYPHLFQGMTYSHDGVFADTLQRARTLAASVSILPMWYDVDTPDALRRLARDLSADANGSADVNGGGARRTREVMAALGEKYGLHV
jgi:rSAM/selenodomain-associated transferase 1